MYSFETSISINGLRPIDVIKADMTAVRRELYAKTKDLPDGDPEIIRLRAERDDKTNALWEEIYAVEREWKARRYTSDPTFEDGSWLIEAGKLAPHTGVYWLDKRLDNETIAAALASQYRDRKFNVSNHGIRFYIWRY